MKFPKKYLILIFALGIAIFYYQTKAIPEASSKLIMSYLYNGSNEENIENVKQTKGSLDEVAPHFFSLNSDGTLNEAESVDTEFVKEMHNQLIKVTPFLSDEWNQEKAQSALENKEELVSQVSNVIEQYDLDGVNVDIENVTEKDKDDYNEFVKLLRESIPEEKELTVAVAANPEERTVGWHGAYDYSTLAQYSDYLMLMAYDEHSVNYETPGPVSSISFAEKSIQYALSQDVPSEKIVLGIPFYGRIWKDDGTILGSNVPLKEVDDLIERYDGNIAYNKEFQSPVATFTITTDDETVTIEGTELTPGTYTLWYENETSIKAKLQLVQKYNLKGSGIWSLGQEAADTWNYYKDTLNTSYEE